VTRIGDVTIERVVPKSGQGSGGGTSGKETKDPVPPPSVSLAKRDPDGGDTISVSEDLQVSIVTVVLEYILTLLWFLKPLHKEERTLYSFVSVLIFLWNFETFI